MNTTVFLLHIVTLSFIFILNSISESIVGSIIDVSRHGIFFQYVSKSIVVISKSKIERVHRLIWRIILTFTGIYFINVQKVYFQLEINDFLFNALACMGFVGFALFSFVLYLKERDKVLVSDSQNELLKINRAIKASMISCILIDYSIGYMRASGITHKIFLNMKDGRRIYLGYATFKNLPGIIMGLYDFLNVEIVDRSPKITELNFKNFSKEPRARSSS